MLEFNPYFRPTAKDLLKNPIFDNIRKAENESTASSRIVLECDENKYQNIYDSEKPRTK